MTTSRRPSGRKKCKGCRCCLASMSSFKPQALEFRASQAQKFRGLFVCLEPKFQIPRTCCEREAAPAPVQLLLPGRDPVNSPRSANSKSCTGQVRIPAYQLMIFETFSGPQDSTWRAQGSSSQAKTCLGAPVSEHQFCRVDWWLFGFTPPPPRALSLNVGGSSGTV